MTRPLPPTCTAARNSALDALGTPTFPGAAATNHAATCSACGRWIAGMGGVSASFGKLDSVAPPEGFADRAVAAAMSARPWQPLHRPRTGWLIAAGVMLCLIVVAWVAPWRVENLPPVPLAPPLPVEESAGPSLEDAGSAFISATRHAALAPLTKARDAFASAPERPKPVAADEPADPLESARHGAARGMKTVTGPAVRAVNFIWRDFGPHAPPAKSD